MHFTAEMKLGGSKTWPKTTKINGQLLKIFHSYASFGYPYPDIWEKPYTQKKLALKSFQLVIERTHSVKIASLYL